MTSIFPTLALDRARVRWEDYLDVVTPIQVGAPLRYKRDDLWAPLGEGGINGFKTRQGVWLFSQIQEFRDAPGVLFAGSVKSTQHSMVATVARHFGKQSVHVLGATSPASCLQHESVRIAQQQGAHFEFARVAYTPALQRRVADLKATDAYAAYWPVEYAVGFGHNRWPADLVRAYHAVGAAQVANLPEYIDDLVVPMGSGHAACSIVLGCLMRGVTATVHLVGIGPSRLAWWAQRWAVLGGQAGFRPGAAPYVYEGEIRLGAASVSCVFYDLISAGYTAYQQMWDETRDGITFHRTYEAKVMRWLREHGSHLVSERTLVWIVGAEPRVHHMQQWAVDVPSTALPSPLICAPD